MKRQLLQHKNTVSSYDAGVMGFNAVFSKKPVKGLTDTGQICTLLYMKRHLCLTAVQPLRHENIASQRTAKL
jgi:hypothetical protein